MREENMVQDLNQEKDRILHLLDQHETWRKGALNLVAAENAMSPIVRSQLGSDLAQRYGDYTGRDPHARRYLGTTFAADLEIEVKRLAAEVLEAQHVELRPISGHIAGNAILMALCKPGDLVVELGRYDGGHRIASKLAASPLIDLNVEFFPFDAHTYNIDLDRTIALVREKRPRMLIVGSSNFLFPIRLRELADRLREFPETVLVYDASHVLGLIVGGVFQRPLAEGAQVVLAGTQKSFPGPQGGVIYTNDEALMTQISSVLHPAVISNHHLARLPALGLALLEMKIWGADYARQVVSNAQALATALVEQGISVVGDGTHYTESHTVVVNTTALGDANVLGELLESAGIITTTVRLPQPIGEDGLRLGTNEITRLGATPDQMPAIAVLIADGLLKRRSPDALQPEVQDMAQQFSHYKFTWSDAAQ